MEIAHLVSSAQLGGTESSVLAMLDSLRALRPDWQLRVIAPQDGAFVDRLRREGMRVEVLPFPRALAVVGEAGRAGTIGGRLRLCLDIAAAAPASLRYAGRLRRVLGEAADVVHAHGFKMHVLAALARPPRARLVWHLHDYITPRRFSAPLLRRLAPRCAVAIANSMSVAADARAALGARLRIALMYNAVDRACFDPGTAPLDLDGLAGLAPPPAGTLRVGLVATFGRWKGHATFLEALSLLPPDLAVRGYVVGGASYQTAGSQHSLESLKAMAGHLRLGDRVAFTGLVYEPAAACRALDVVVHASTQPEPFGMVIAEAMACGRPVIISRAGGAAELVEEGVDGLAHAAGDAAALAGCIESLLRDPDLRRRLGEAAGRTAAARFHPARLGGELARVYAPPAR